MIELRQPIQSMFLLALAFMVIFDTAKIFPQILTADRKEKIGFLLNESQKILTIIAGFVITDLLHKPILIIMGFDYNDFLQWIHVEKNLLGAYEVVTIIAIWIILSKSLSLIIKGIAFLLTKSKKKV